MPKKSFSIVKSYGNGWYIFADGSNLCDNLYLTRDGIVTRYIRTERDKYYFGTREEARQAVRDYLNPKLTLSRLEPGTKFTFQTTDRICILLNNCFGTSRHKYAYIDNDDYTLFGCNDDRAVVLIKE